VTVYDTDCGLRSTEAGIPNRDTPGDLPPVGIACSLSALIKPKIHMIQDKCENRRIQRTGIDNLNRLHQAAKPETKPLCLIIRIVLIQPCPTGDMRTQQDQLRVHSAPLNLRSISQDEILEHWNRPKLPWILVVRASGRITMRIRLDNKVLKLLPASRAAVKEKTSQSD